MLKRIALLALSCLCVLGTATARPAGAQVVRRLSDKDVPVLVNELRVRLNVPDTATALASAPARVADTEFSALVAAGVQAMLDLNDPNDLAQQEACAAQWGSRDEAGQNLRKETQNRRHNLEVLLNDPAALLPLLEKYNQASKAP